MNRGPFIFLGVFFLVSLTWAFSIYKPVVDSGDAQPHVTPDGVVQERVLVGIAAQGREVYQQLGCVACHTQQIRVASGSDISREWGTRQSVIQDYIDEDRSLAGTRRIGPDLRNVGDRLNDAAWHHLHFYNPQITSEGSNMPAYAFLYETREIKGEKSARALDVPEEFAPEGDYEVVPTRRADALVAYMLNLKEYELETAPKTLEVMELELQESLEAQQ